ncbi:MAG: hypothetical protein ABIV11_08565 [Gemmatimonadaceae bacterium]
MTDTRGRDGFALLLSILAVVVVGALIIATHTAVRLEHDVAVAGVNRQRAFAASENALWSSIATWDPATSALPPGGATSKVIRAGGDSATITTVRLNNEFYWLVADGRSGDPQRVARRRTAINVAVVSDSAGTRVTPVRRSWSELH